MKTDGKPWQIRLYEKSLMKKEKVRLIKKKVNFKDKKVLDLGCAQGVVSYFLKKEGGNWLHTDLDLANLVTARELLKANVFMVGGDKIPLRDDSTDIILALDILEHLTEDQKMVQEMKRMLKPRGKVVISTPISGKFFLLNKLKKWMGLKPEIYGHKREGYSLGQLRGILEEAGFKITCSTTYAKFFTELFEVFLNVFYTRKNRIKVSNLKSGSISPTSQKDINKNLTLFRIYGYLIYPVVYLITKLDKLLWFKTGYATLVIAEKNHNTILREKT